MSQTENSTKPLDLALQELIGREATPEEIAKFYKIKEHLGFSEHDSVWSFLLAFGHYEILYGDIAKNIGEQARQTLADHKLALEATAGAAERAVKAGLIESVSKASKDAIEAGRLIGSKQKSRVVLICTALITMALVSCTSGLLAWRSYVAGESAGAADAALNMEWVQSPQGRAAKAFSALNPVQAMLDCQSNFQIRTEKNATYCVPYDEKAKLTTGWRIK